MKNSSNLKLQFAIIGLFFIAILTCGYFINDNIKKLSYINKFYYSIEELIYINKELNINVEDTNLYLNYDKIENSIKKFDKSIDELIKISNSSEHKKYFIVSDIDTLHNIKAKFELRKQKIRDFNSKISVTYYILRDIKYFMQSNKSAFLSQIYFKFSNIDIRTKSDSDEFLKFIEEIQKNQPKNEDLLLFTQKMQRYIDFYSQAIKIKDELKNSEFSHTFDKYFTKIAKRDSKIIGIVKNLFIISLVISVMFLIWSVNLLRKFIISTRDLIFFKAAIEHGYSSVIFTDKNFNIIYLNNTSESISGYEKKNLLGKHPRIFKSFLHDENFYNNITKTITNAQIWHTDKLISKAKNGLNITEQATILPVINDDKIQGYICIKLDKTKELNITKELNSKNTELKNQIYKDSITNLGNYHALTHRINLGENGIVIYIGILNFSNFDFFYEGKIINEIILAVSKTLQLCIKTNNINCELFKFGLEEFCILYKDYSVEDDIEKIKSYFNSNEIEINIDNENKKILQKIELIIGVSSRKDTSVTRLVQSMWAYKEAKKIDEKVYFYKPNQKLEQNYFKNLEVVGLIQYALKNDKVIVECQPIFNIKKDEKKAKKFEILIRILDQNNKIHYPGEFLGVAKQMLFYNLLTIQVIKIAFGLVEKYPNKEFSINLSSLDMTNENICKIFIDSLKSCKHPNNLYVEILESESIDNYDTIMPFIKEIKSLGCKLSIDDFGSGYSNYYRMLEFDVDVLKIDGSIIKLLPEDENAKIVMGTIVNFAKKMNYAIVAEFVSNEEILNEVKRYDVDYVQGFYLGKPILPEYIDFD